MMGMNDGRLSNCKECVKASVRAYRQANLARVRENDRIRGRSAAKRATVRRYSQTDKGKDALLRANQHYRQSNPERYKAQNAVNNAVRDGKLVKPSRCQDCRKVFPSRQIHAHHADYMKPLEVRWVCKSCHTERHYRRVKL